jgi:hypothetical protein
MVLLVPIIILVDVKDADIHFKVAPLGAQRDCLLIDCLTIYFQDQFPLELPFCIEEDGLLSKDLSLMLKEFIGDVCGVSDHAGEVGVGNRVAHGTL